MKELTILSDGVHSVAFKCDCGTQLEMRKVCYHSHWYCPTCKVFVKVTIEEVDPPKPVYEAKWVTEFEDDAASTDIDILSHGSGEIDSVRLNAWQIPELKDSPKEGFWKKLKKKFKQ